MDGGRLERIEELYHAAREREFGERATFLHDACGSDEALRSEVEELLALDAVSGPLEGPAWTPSASQRISETLLSAEGGVTTIGRYRPLQKIGEGGMGEVWLAEQIEPVCRRVALKAVKTGLNTREVMARFESERQALALMDHPAIATVFDADSTPQGTPYFVMEYVAGVPITTYCDNQGLTTRERLELFMRVCEGVQHAHQKAIIHRDLKPSNILVTDVDGNAAPKIIDFGIAKALTQKLTADTIFTRLGAIIGTPEYMSPEQAISSGADIDTRTDVYSLGVILYELLAGAPPIELRMLTFEEFLRRLREEEPPKPSTKIRTQDAATSMEMARKRQTEPLALARQVRGDLDAIALKALEKDRARRYGSPSDLAADIGRHLKNEPVLAVPPSIAYRARKFARRYRGALITAAAVALALIAAAAISIRQSIRANSQTAVAQAVSDFLQNDLLAQASAANQSDPDLKVRTALDRAAVRIGGKFERQPEVEAAIRGTIGRTYLRLGLYAEGRKQFERALELQRRVWGARNPNTLKTMARLGSTAYLQGRYPEAEALFQQALAIQRRVLGADHADTLYSMNGLGNAYYFQGKYEQAEALHSQILQIRRRVLGPEHPDTLSSMNNLALVYLDEGKFAQAEVLYDETLKIKRRVLGPEHPETLISMHNLALVYVADGKFAQAEALARQTVETDRRVLGPEQAETLSSVSALAGVYTARGEHAQADQLYSHTLEVQRRVMGPEHPDTLDTLSNFGFMYQAEGKYALAEAQFGQALAGRRHILGSEHPETMLSAADLALVYVSQGKFVAAEPLAREAFEFNRKKQPDDWQRFRAESLLGESLAGQKKYADAEPWLVEGYQGMLARKARIAVPDRYHLERAHDWLMQFYRAWGKPQEAEEWLKK